MNIVFLNILNFVFKGSLNIPEYRCLLIGRVQYLYTMEHAVKNIAYYRCLTVSVSLLSLGTVRLTMVSRKLYTDKIIKNTCGK